MNIGIRIKLARKKAKLSMKYLADQVGVSTEAISKFECELTLPRQSTLIKLGGALSVAVEYFFRENSINTLAPTYRKHYKFGKTPIVDLAGTLEKKGIAIIAVDGYQRFDSLSCSRLGIITLLTFEECRC